MAQDSERKICYHVCLPESITLLKVLKVVRETTHTKTTMAFSIMTTVALVMPCLQLEATKRLHSVFVRRCSTWENVLLIEPEPSYSLRRQNGPYLLGSHVLYHAISTNDSFEYQQWMEAKYMVLHCVILLETKSSYYFPMCVAQQCKYAHDGDISKTNSRQTFHVCQCDHVSSISREGGRR